jgi:peptidoglycan/LPS O-acetylase OafA/YrhL
MQRLTRLDGVRGLLAVYVMIGHGEPFIAWPSWWQPVHHFFSHGLAAVDLFFALSGLVIAQSLSRFPRVGQFLQTRARRLLPVYLLVLAGAVLIIALGSPLPLMPWLAGHQAASMLWATSMPRPLALHLLAHLTFTHGLIPDGALPFAYVTLLGPAWSLSTEWQFYVAAALVVACLGDARRHLPHLAWMLIVLALMGEIYGLAASPYWRFSRAFLPNQAGYFALGVASARLLVERNQAARRHYLLILLLVLLLAAARLQPGKILPPLLWTLLLASEYAPDAPILRALGRILNSRLAQGLGAISYPLYLVNEPIQRLMALLICRLVAPGPAAFALLWAPASIAATLLVASLLHRHVEFRFLRRRL